MSKLEPNIVISKSFPHICYKHTYVKKGQVMLPKFKGVTK